MSVDQPEAPDPKETATAQFGAEIGAGQAGAIINNVNQRDAYGNKIKYSQNGWQKVQAPDGSWMKVPTFRSKTKLSPDQQALLDQQETLGLSMGNLAQSGIDAIANRGNLSFDGAPSVTSPTLKDSYSRGTYNQFTDNGPDFLTGYDSGGSILRGFAGGDDLQMDAGGSRDLQYDAGLDTNFSPDSWSDDRRRVEDAMMSRSDEMFGKDMDALDSRLAAQGVSMRNNAARSDFYDLEKVRNDQRMNAILAGGQEQSRLAGLDMAGKNAANSARLAGGQFANNAAAQDYQQRLAGQAAHNAAQGQEYSQNQGRAAFTNDAQAQANSQNAAQAAFYNTGVGAQYQRDIGTAGFNSQQTSQQEQSDRNAADFYNQVGQQDYGNQQSDYQRYVQEMMMTRDDPLKLAQIMMGQQINAPQFQDPYRQPVNAPNIMDFTANNYNQQMANNRQMMSGLFGLAGQALPWG